MPVPWGLRVPHSPADLALPHDQWRPYQREAIGEIVNAFRAGKRFVVLEAPPGSGKSAIAMGVAQLLGKGATILCSTKQLQLHYRDIYGAIITVADELAGRAPGFAVIMGRRAYPCARPLVEGATAEDCYHHQAGLDSGVKCPYWSWPGEPEARRSPCAWVHAMHDAIHANIIVGNYALLLTSRAHVRPVLAQSYLRVYDEAHLIDDELMGYAQVHIPQRVLERFEWGEPAYRTKVEAWREWAEGCIPDIEARERVVRSALRRLMARREATAGEHQRGKGDREAMACIRELGDLAILRHKLDLLRNAETGAWVFERTERGFTFQAVWTRAWYPLLFGPVQGGGDHRHLLMSATILDAKQFCWLLGIPKERVLFLRMPSTFAPERRPIRYEPVGPMSLQERADTVDALLDAIQGKLAEHPNEKGVIHTNSWAIYNAIMHLGHPRLVGHTTQDRAHRLAAFKEAREPLVLVSPSMDVGVDLPYDEARWQAVCKVPFPYLGDKRIQARAYASPRWYAWRTAQDLIQATGRVCRAGDDYGVTYILDSDFGPFYREHRRLFPRWWAKALWPIP